MRGGARSCHRVYRWLVLRNSFSSPHLLPALTPRSVHPSTPPPLFLPIPRTVFAASTSPAFEASHKPTPSRTAFPPSTSGGYDRRYGGKQQARGYAQQAGGGRPRTPMAVPFQVTPEEARALLREHLTGHLLAPAIADVDSSVALAAMFQPFWTFTADGGRMGVGGNGEGDVV
ncbi:unnamed protein product [Closterium sp. Naga37s-1]|nr:unnamed protein product [Closterium sp. Naga37s-1]